MHAFKIEKSKFDRGNGKCLHLSIDFAGEQHVLFSGSGVLMEMIEKVPAGEFPFQTTIIQDNERFEFT